MCVSHLYKTIPSSSWHGISPCLQAACQTPFPSCYYLKHAEEAGWPPPNLYFPKTCHLNSSTLQGGTASLLPLPQCLPWAGRAGRLPPSLPLPAGPYPAFAWGKVTGDRYYGVLKHGLGGRGDRAGLGKRDVLLCFALFTALQALRHTYVYMAA